ncbi:brix domain protein [Dictyocaulus viviparus]|uniref:Brix domain protein n=1 Tax=Dictyocaulus viviparus TaxID=29172 RepID=A0A0D8YC35_DICVI|nr:brix domain protein [Dictyocaulus viviparus]
MIRRENRLRREYIYRKSLEAKQRVVEEKRAKIRDALENNKKIDTDLQKDAIELAKGAEWGGQVRALLLLVDISLILRITDISKIHNYSKQIISVDDEYRWAGTKDPKIVITTSRDPSSKLKVFVKEMKLVFPNAQRLNRGHYDVKQLVQACRANDVTDFIMLTETRGNPDGMVVCHLPFGPTAYFTLSNVVMRHDIPEREPMSEQYPHLIFHNLGSKLGQRFTSILKYLFPVPKENSKRVITFANNDDFISFRHHTFSAVKGEIELKEVGPRFELRPYAIKLGTLENIAAAEDEWVLRAFTNTARKRQLLSDKQDESEDES